MLHLAMKEKYTLGVCGGRRKAEEITQRQEPPHLSLQCEHSIPVRARFCKKGVKWPGTGS